MAFPVVASSPGFSSTDLKREWWDLTSFENAEVDAGTALVNNGRPGVAYTPSGGFSGSSTVGPFTVTGPAGGATLDAKQVSVATDGAFEFPVTGVTAATPNGTPVYAVVASNKITELTTTATGNTLFGVVQTPKGKTPSADKCVVKIGVSL